MILKYYKVDENAYEPKYGTEDSACFDIFCSLIKETKVLIYESSNNVKKKFVNNDGLHSKNYIEVLPGERALIPTNLIFDIPKGYSIRLHPRSGLSIKNGITLVNAEGVIDSDYIDPCFVTIINLSGIVFTVSDGDRLCQAEIVKNIQTEFQQIQEKPTVKTDRNGGFGSTGV